MNAERIEAAQAALRRVFSHFVPHDYGAPDSVAKLPPPRRALAGSDGFIVEPVPHEHMVVREPIEIGGTVFESEIAAQGSAGNGWRWK